MGEKGNCVANIAISISPVFHVSMCSGDSEIFSNFWWIFQSITQPDLILIKYDFNETKSNIYALHSLIYYRYEIYVLLILRKNSS